jgi:hypothetical protein
MRRFNIIDESWEEGFEGRRREDIILVLIARFGPANVASLATRVRTEARPDELNRWLDLAATAPDLPAFLAQVGG